MFWESKSSPSSHHSNSSASVYTAQSFVRNPTTLSDLMCTDKKASIQYRDLKIFVLILWKFHTMDLEHIHCHPQFFLFPLPPFASLKGTTVAKNRENSIIQDRGRTNKIYFKLLIKNAINTSHLALSYISGSTVFDKIMPSLK